jgi:hypothetical protein
MNTAKRVLFCALLSAPGAFSSHVFALPSSQVSTSGAPRAVNPNDYPKLTQMELGHVRHLVKLAHQLPGDWSGFSSQWLLTERTQQFQIAFSGMTLALAQHEYTPAYRELYRSAIEAYIEKLEHPDIWERWFLSSRSGTRGGILADMQSGWIDPIAKDNIMLKAYLLQLGAAHEMLYGDHKYDQPGAFTFYYRGQGMGNGLIKFRYSLEDVAKNIHKEVVDSGYIGSSCEPARIFWVCQAPSSVGFLHFDQVHGTHYADVLPKMKDAWVKKGFIDSKTYRYAEAIFTSPEDRSANQKPVELSPMDQDIGGWGGMFNHAWDKEFTEAAYYGVDHHDRDDSLKYFLTGEYAKAPKAADNPIHAYDSVAWGLFTAYAAEVGDKDAVNKMLAYAQRNFNPVWENGEYYYPRSDDFSVDANGNSHGVDPWTGNVLISMARLNKGGGFYNLYNQPWGEAQYRQPYISNVDAVSTNVSQAFYDKTKDALIVTLEPGPIAAKQIQFTVKQLDSTKTYTVTRNKKVFGRLDRRAVGHDDGNGSMTWRADGSVLITTEIAKAQTFIFSASR